MWIVRLAHDVVLAEFSEAFDPVVVLDETAEDVTAEGFPDVERVEVGPVTGVTHERGPRFTQYRCLSSTCSARSRK